MKKIKIKSNLDSTWVNPFCGVKAISKVLIKQKKIGENYMWGEGGGLICIESIQRKKNTVIYLKFLRRGEIRDFWSENFDRERIIEVLLGNTKTQREKMIMWNDVRGLQENMLRKITFLLTFVLLFHYRWEVLMYFRQFWTKSRGRRRRGGVVFYVTLQIITGTENYFIFFLAYSCFLLLFLE